jgi:hypothetical protein
MQKIRKNQEIGQPLMFGGGGLPGGAHCEF